MNKLIINFTPTGMIPTKEMTPHVPISPEEIVKDVLKAAELGASIVHLHARNPDGTPTYKKEEFKKIIGGIREKNKELVICVTTSGRDYPEVEKRGEVLDLEGIYKPDMASLTLSSLNFNKTASVNSPDTIKALVSKMNEKGIKPELEVFDAGMVNYMKYLIKKDLIKPPYYVNLLFGNIACAQSDLLHVGVIINDLPKDSVWALAGIGNCQNKMTSLGVISGGNVRIGLEDNIWFDEERTILASNEMLVSRIADFAKTYGRELATPKEVRKLLGLRRVEECPLPN